MVGFSKYYRKYLTSISYYVSILVPNQSVRETSRVLSYSIPDLSLKGLVSLTNNMKEGTIARVTDRGYGFIAQEGVEKDLFFHSNELGEGIEFSDLQEGDKVTFEIAEGPKGLNAVNVIKV